MVNQPSPPAFRRTCPACNRPVEPGYNFCETCGTPIKELPTCSKCGTQFIAPVKFCEVCGAPVTQEEGAEPADSLEYIGEEDTAPAEDQVLELDEEEIPEPETGEVPEYMEEEDTGAVEVRGPDEEEIPEPDSDELAEDTEEEIIVEAKDETPHQYNKEIQVPDTDELLELYGKEYDDDETLESLHTQKPPPPILHPAKKPVSVPAGRASAETVDDVLFLSPGEQKAAAKPRVTTARIIAGCLVLIAIIAAVYFIGRPMLTGSGGFSVPGNPPAVEITPVPQPTVAGVLPQPAPTQTPAPASRGLTPQPTQVIPSGQKFSFQVQKSPVTSRILVIYEGSQGWDSIRSADIRVTHPDGSVSSGIIHPMKGITEMIVDGSQQADRVEIIAQMYSGERYRVYDELVS